MSSVPVILMSARPDVALQLLHVVQNRAVTVVAGDVLPAADR